MLLDFLLPAPCVVCGKPPKPICSACRPIGNFRTDTLRNMNLYYSFELSGGIEVILKSYKDRSRMALEATLAGQLDSLIQRVSEIESFDCYAIPPKNSKNFRRRGFNPIERLAGKTRLARIRRVRLASTRKISDQRSLTMKARRENTAMAFRARTGSGRVLLVDDVTTSGATLLEMRRSLEVAGFTVVASCVLARRFGIEFDR